MSRQRGIWVNFGDSSNPIPIAPIYPGTISTCMAFPNAGQTAVVTNGKIGSISDTVIVSPRTSQALLEHDPK
jgi:hypothetical protein